ncbi:LacI family DNA-binding transcriptional regulator [Dactylosporangium fulvum]|uniref:LacI family transcriptional regulator n=1 Tax=Dactylosporangium fulvum TaxID=53359 RepID=A0ABY5WAQ9_9ACTN|nr:LacI family DNA-binding transcriptional regulator [Dactylosporangium fulvum]UWP86957.1 LacI family transcriptional regulator [Dactylosporangium fulvum]
MSRRVTQRDIARMTGVSQATVSLVLNNRTGDDVRIAPETRQRVLDAIRSTGYVADPVARRLVSGRNRILGVFTYEPLFPSGAADFYHPFLVGIEERAEELDCDLLLFTSGRGRRVHDESRIGLADGTILLGRHVDELDLRRLVAERHAFVSVGRRDEPGVPYVGADYPSAVAAFLDRALALGHRRIGYLGTGGPAESHADRLRGFAGFDVAHLRPPAGLDAALTRGLTAVFTEEYADAVALIAEATARGLAVPGDLSVVALAEPSGGGPVLDTLARLAIPRREMGWEAVTHLTAVIEGAAPGQRLLSCGMVPGTTLGDTRHVS